LTHTVHLALATAMASVVFTSSSSVLAHHRLGSVDWSIVRRMAPGMVAGSLLSTLAAGWLSQRVLALGFALIVYGGATQMLLGRKPAPGRTLPGPLPMTALGLGIGVICGLVSAGGAFSHGAADAGLGCGDAHGHRHGGLRLACPSRWSAWSAT
jgi:uncharacterized membrane protein YfcA